MTTNGVPISHVLNSTNVHMCFIVPHRSYRHETARERGGSAKRWVHVAMAREIIERLGKIAVRPGKL